MAKLKGKAKADFLARMAKGRKQASKKSTVKKSTVKKTATKKAAAPKKTAAKTNGGKWFDLPAGTRRVRVRSVAGKHIFEAQK